MGLILRTTHDNLPAGAVVTNGRLTVQQMDNNFIFLQSIVGTGGTGTDGLSSLSLVTLTVASASQYIADSLVVVGQPYLITDADLYLYGVGSQFGFGDGTNILLYGVDEKSFTSIGSGKFYNPNYNNVYGVWDSSATYSIGDKAIYGGKVWNLTGTASVGYNDYWSLESDWEVIDYTDTDFYNVVWDEVEYNIVDNYITSRYDAINNNRVTDSYGTWYFNCETHPIQSFRWGHDSVQNCKVDNSYLGCLNFVSGYIYDINLSNGSIIYDIDLHNGTELYNITLSNNSILGGFTTYGGNIYNINLNNDSSLQYFYLLGYSYLENITIDNNSSIEEFILDNNSYLSGIKLENDSIIGGITLYSSFLNDISLTNDSYIISMGASASNLTNINITNESGFGAGITMDNASISRMELTNNGLFIGEGQTPTGPSGDGDIIITDSYLQNIVITNNSLFTGPITITNNSHITELYMENAYIGGLEQDSQMNDPMGDHLYSITIDDSNLENIMLEGHSYIANLEMYNSTLSNTKLSNYSKITSDGSSVFIEDSQLDLINLSNHSYIGYDRVEIINGTNWYDVKLDNYSKIGGYIYFDSSRFGVISLNNNSKIWGSYDNIYINDSDVHYISLDNHSEISGRLDIESSSLQNIDLSTSFLGGYGYTFSVASGSTLQYLNLSNGSWFEADNDDITIRNGSTVEYINLTNGSWINGYIDIHSSYLAYLDLTNDSYLGYGVNINSGAELKQIKLENNSRLVGSYEVGDIYVYQNSIMQNIEITNDSYLSGWMDIGEGSFFQNIKIDNNSYISSGIYVYGWDSAPYNQGSTFENVTVTNGSSITGTVTVGNYNANENGNGYLGNVTVTNGSVLGNNSIYIRDRARLEYITINNFSKFNKVDLVGANTKMYYIDINNYSYINPSNLELNSGSEIKYLTLDNHSHIMGSTYLHNSSKIKRVQMANYSKIDGYNNVLDHSSEIQYMSMINVSDNSGTSCYGTGFTDFYLSGTSSIHGLDMKWSTLGGLWLDDNSRIEGLAIENNSRVFNVNIQGSSALLNSKITNSYLDGHFTSPWAYGSILLNDNSWMENVVIDTVDFPSWNANHYGISLQTNSTIRNIVLKNMCANDRVAAFAGNWDNRRGSVEDIYLYESYLENITIDNSGQTYDIFEGWLRQIELNNSFISSLDANLSQIDTIGLSTSNIVGVKIVGSGLYDLYLGEGSSIQDLEITDTFGVYSNNLTYGTQINRLVLNKSWFYENNYNNSVINDGNLTLSKIYGNDFTNSGLRNFNLSGSVLSNLDQTSNNEFYNFELKNQLFNFNNDNSNTYNLASTIGHNNTIKHQFSTNLAGLGDGYVSIPRYIVPGSGWYIEKVILDSTILVVSGTVSFSLGLHESHPESVLDNVDSTVLSNKVKVYDLNSGISGGKSTGLDWIGLYLHDEGGSSTITSGTMNIEITLKNTNYFTAWWE